MEPNASNEPGQANKVGEADMTSTVSGLHDAGIEIVGQEAPEENAAQEEINRTIGNAYGPITQKPPSTTAVPGVQNDPSIKPIRTFKSDAEEAVRYQNISTSQIALAEQKRKLAQAESTPIDREGEKKSHAGTILILGIAIILATAGFVYYQFFLEAKNSEGSLPQELRAQTILPYVKAGMLTVDPQKDILGAIGQALSGIDLQSDGVYAVIPVPNGTTTTLGVGILLQGTHVPDMLGRSLDERYMIGSYTKDEKAPFIILKDTYFQNAFAGMLQWERDMRADLISLIRISHPNEAPTLTNTASFEDAVVSNIDTRVLKNSAGEVILTYAFADKDTIVITTQTGALKALLDKLLAVRVVQ
ncbi:MAG: hypothetical protein WC763_03520 [Candidatus Paceibacterota bacterium]|jgi:hypothetical protein